MKSWTVLLLLGYVAAGSVAYGAPQGATTEAPPAGSNGVSPAALEMTDHYNPRAALNWSLVPTVAGTTAGLGLMLLEFSNSSYDTFQWGLGLTIVTLVVAPSLGHLYARNHGHAWGTLAARGGAALVGLLSAMATLEFSSNDDGEIEGSMAAWPTALSWGALVGLAIWSAATAPRSARRANEKLRAVADRPRFHLSPTALRTAQQATSPGLALGGTF